MIAAMKSAHKPYVMRELDRPVLTLPQSVQASPFSDPLLCRARSISMDAPLAGRFGVRAAYRFR